MMGLIFLLSDFGTSDTYVAQMKAVILSECAGDVSIVDLTHDIKAGSVSEGAFHLLVSHRFIPAGSVVIAVIDPGVGTARRGLVCEADGVFYTGPDNGLFGLLPRSRSWILPDPQAGCSSTFHGRDVFAPAGARLMVDPGWVDFLETVENEDLVPSDIVLPVQAESGLEVSVAHVDRFGNLVLWLPPSDTFHPVEMQLPGGEYKKITEVKTYGDNPGVLILQGSQGFMEIAAGGGSASDILGLCAGDRILLIDSERRE